MSAGETRIFHHTGTVWWALERQGPSSIKGQSAELWRDRDLPPNRDILMSSGEIRPFQPYRDIRIKLWRDKDLLPYCTGTVWWALERRGHSTIQGQSDESGKTRTFHRTGTVRWVWRDKDLPLYKDSLMSLERQGLSTVQGQSDESGKTRTFHRTGTVWWVWRDKDIPPYRDSFMNFGETRTFHTTGTVWWAFRRTITFYHTGTVSRQLRWLCSPS